MQVTNVFLHGSLVRCTSEDTTFILALRTTEFRERREHEIGLIVINCVVYVGDQYFKGLVKLLGQDKIRIEDGTQLAYSKGVEFMIVSAFYFVIQRVIKFAETNVHEIELKIQMDTYYFLHGVCYICYKLYSFYLLHLLPHGVQAFENWTITVLTHNSDFGPLFLLLVKFNKVGIEGLICVLVFDPDGCKCDLSLTNHKPLLIIKYGNVKLLIQSMRNMWI